MPVSPLRLTLGFILRRDRSREFWRPQASACRVRARERPCSISFVGCRVQLPI